MKRRLTKITALLLTLVLSCTFILTACNSKNENRNEGQKPDITIEEPSVSEPGNDTPHNPEAGEDDPPKVDPPVIPDESKGVEIVLPENVDREILSYTYASISLDLMSYGYEVFNGYITTSRGDEYGIAYTDYEDAIKFENDEKIYVSTGFLAFSIDESISGTDDLLIVQPVDENAEDIVDESYGYVLACIENGIPAGHFVVNNTYVIYVVENGKVDIKALENKPENYDLSLGTIYDYDKQDVIYVPFDDIDSSPIGYIPLTEEIDYEAIKTNLYNVIAEQQSKGYAIQTITISFLSVDTLNALYGILAQGDTLNGYSFDALNGIEFDSAKQYIHFNEDGSITLKDLPPIPVTQYKSIFDWLVDALVLVGAGALAIVSITFLGPAGGVIAAGVLGAGIEYFSQTVLGGKKFSEVNWAKVGIMAISGALGAMVPCAGTLGYIAAGAVGGLTSAALTAVDGGSWEDILVSATTGALTSMLMHGLFSSCFPAGTQVLTQKGYLPIELVTVGTLVASYNIYANKMEWKPVLETYTNYTNSLVRVNFSNGDSILSTATHPYYVLSSNAYISAGQLKAGDELLSINGELFVTSIEEICLTLEIPVYNFHVADNNNYLVDDSSVLVHNSCKHQGSEWKKTRSNFWQEESKLQKYAGKLYELTDDNLALMSKGKAPLDSFNRHLELHHIEGINNNMSNIIPLDKATHTAFHQAKGYVGFTAQDLMDFLKEINLLDIFF